MTPKPKQQKEEPTPSAKQRQTIAPSFRPIQSHTTLS